MGYRRVFAKYPGTAPASPFVQAVSWLTEVAANKKKEATVSPYVKIPKKIGRNVIFEAITAAKSEAV